MMDDNHRYWLSRALLVSLCIACVTACAGSSDDTGDDSQEFVALQSDFLNYATTWHSFDLGSSEVDNVHTAGDRIVYINQLPPHGATEFPVGTILVKTIAADTATPGKTFAMAKRGGNFNSVEAPGWEWFELQAGTDGASLIVWRGLQPPPGENYAGATGDVCNMCHAAAKTNDYVQNSMLTLSSF